MKNAADKIRPYGPAYQQMCAREAVTAGCSGNAMGILYCLFNQSGLWDWQTGQTNRPISHRDIGKAMGGLGYDTVRRAIAKLRKAGILDYADHRGRGVVWSDGTGQANKYKLMLPPLGGGQNITTPPVKNATGPRANNDHHYQSSFLSKGDKGPPSRRQEAPSSDRTPEEQAQFSQWEREYSYSYALGMLKRQRQQQALAAE